MHRLSAVLCLALTALLGPLAGAGSAAEYGAVLTGASYVSGQTLQVTGEVTCPAGHYFDLQIVVTQKSGAEGAGIGYGTCTGELQQFSAGINNISDSPFRKGRVTTSTYGGSYFCDAESCNDLNLANHLEQTFRLR
jgi:hypothetical protein